MSAGMLRCQPFRCFQRPPNIFTWLSIRRFSPLASRGAAVSAAHPTAKIRSPSLSRDSAAALGVRPPSRRLHVDDVDEVPMLAEYGDEVARIRSIVQSNSPLSLSDADRTDISSTLQRILPGPSVKRLLFCTMLCCPFYAAVNAHLPSPERYKHNQLFVVYVSGDDDIHFQFRPKLEADPREYVMDDWLVLREFTSFTKAYLEGVSVAVEGFAAHPECVIYCDPDFGVLRKSVKDPRANFHEEFLNACAAKAMNVVYERGWSKSVFMLREDTSLAEMCHSQRYKNIVDRALSIMPPLPSWPDYTENGHEDELEVIERLKTEFGRHQLELRMKEWHHHVCVILREGSPVYHPPQFLQHTFDKMAVCYYSSNIQLQPKVVVSKEELGVVDNLMARFRRASLKMRGATVVMKPFLHIASENQLLLTVSGSQLYNLALPTSDEDFVAAFRRPSYMSLVNSRIQDKPGVIDFRAEAGRSGVTDLAVIAAFEARKVVTMLLRGSVEWYQIMYHEEPLLFEHPLFKELRQNRHRLMSETVIDNFRKYAKAFLYRVDREQSSVSALKSLYQVFHKLNQVEKLIRGEEPQVICTGETRDFIMKIRRGELEHQVDELKEEAWNRMIATSVYREEHGPAWQATSDLDYLRDWLQRVDGFRCVDEEWTGSVFDVLVDGVRLFPDPATPQSLEQLQRVTPTWDLYHSGVCN